MDSTSALPALAVFLLALATAHALGRAFPAFAAARQTHRLASIDGLRGLLALSVFTSHACIWRVYLTTGVWELPASRLYIHLGQSAVLLFFMITGFLFSTKLLQEGPFGWGRFYVSRIARIVPLYLFALACVVAIVMHESGGRLRELAGAVLGQVARWLAFALTPPDINAMAQTWVITAGVTWTLHYEWLFYLALPLVGFFLSRRPPVGYLAVAILTVASVPLLGLAPWPLLAFACGMLACLAVRHRAAGRIATSRTGTLILLACLGLAVALYPSAYAAEPMLLLCAAFTLVAGGNSVFGMLTGRAARLLGEISYSVYLLHGIGLFVLFRFFYGFERAAAMSPWMHWAVVLGWTPALIGLCCLTFHWIERPAIVLGQGAKPWGHAEVAPVPAGPR